MTGLGRSLIGKPTDPLLKWAGGKRALAQQIVDQFRPYEGIYYEPFVGGGAVFFHHKPARAVLADVNPELVNCYQQIKDHAECVSSVLSRWENTEEAYYRIRKKEYLSPIWKAARTIYLTSLSFNGIYRQNLKGKFNVPYGYKVHLKLPDLQRLQSVKSKLCGCGLQTGDFERTAAPAKAGDLVYLDPPYTVAHNNNGFVKYNAEIFSWEDQRRLASFAKTLVKRGCQVVVSNADHPSIDELYKGFLSLKLKRASVIAAATKHRGSITEALFVG